jgi:hypothetical protein
MSCGAAAQKSRGKRGSRTGTFGTEIKGAPDLEPLSHDRCSAQQESILSTLHLTDPGASPRTASYDIREFVY